MTTTPTGRMASAHPNIQNIPIRTKIGRAIREAFVGKQPVPDTADHPDLPLGLRRHPRFAARILMPVGAELDIVSIYSHDEAHLDEVVMRLWQPADRVERERWDDEAKEWQPSPISARCG